MVVLTALAGKNHEKQRPEAKAAARSNLGRKEMEMETPAYPVRISSRANATKAADCATAAVAVHLTRCCDGGLAAHLLSALAATTEQRNGAMYLSD